jgi:hypothetical protein
LVGRSIPTQAGIQLSARNAEKTAEKPHAAADAALGLVGDNCLILIPSFPRKREPNPHLRRRINGSRFAGMTNKRGELSTYYQGPLVFIPAWAGMN